MQPFAKSCTNKTSKSGLQDRKVDVLRELNVVVPTAHPNTCIELPPSKRHACCCARLICTPRWIGEHDCQRASNWVDVFIEDLVDSSVAAGGLCPGPTGEFLNVWKLSAVGHPATVCAISFIKVMERVTPVVHRPGLYQTWSHNRVTNEREG
jgi:hypothetical protein